MNGNFKIVDIREPGLHLENTICWECEYWGNYEKIDIIEEFNKAERFSTFIKSIFFNFQTRKKHSKYVNCFLKNGGMGKAVLTKKNTFAGIALYGNYSLFPALNRFSVYPPNADSAFLGCVFVDEYFSGFNLEERILLSVQKDLVKNHYKSVETIAKRINDDISEEEFNKIHFLPVKFLISKGFYIEKNDEFYPLLKMDLKNIITVSEEESLFYKLFLKRQFKKSSITEARGKNKK